MKRIELRKYQNRRYYNTTESRHMSLEEIHRKICDGKEIRVTDAKTGADITAKVLLQILLEYEPLKLDFFPAELLHQVIRVNDSILKEFFDNHFGRAFEAFCRSREQMDELLRRSHLVPGAGGNPFISPFEAMNPFSVMFSGSQAKGAGAEELAKQVEELRKQVEDLRRKTAE